MPSPKKSGPYPYGGQFEAIHSLPEEGWPREKLAAQLKVMAESEDAFWQTGKCSGTMYGGVIAATWAVMLHIGKNGYLAHAQKIFETRAPSPSAGPFTAAPGHGQWQRMSI